jgi:hypothetical protein
MKAYLLAAALLATAGAASAALTPTGGSEVHFTGYDSATVSTDPQNAGLRNAQLVSDDALDELTITFLGKDAGHVNQLFFDGELAFDNLAAPLATYTTLQGAGVLDFAFKDTHGGATVPNGGNPGTFASYVVLGTFDAAGAFSPYTQGGKFDYVLGFNDSWIYDTDYNDLVIGINVTPVPEPETYAMLLAGLGIMGFVAGRRRFH